MARQTENQCKLQIEQYLDQWSSQSGYYKDLATRLRQLDQDASAPISRLGITSCYRGEGSSTVAMLLSATMCQHFGLEVLMIDANAEHPTFETNSKSENTWGLLNALADEVEITDCVIPSTLENLNILPLGKPAWGEIDYSKNRLAEIFETLSEHTDLIIVDMPFVILTPEWQAIAQQLDGVLLVVDAAQTRVANAVLAKHHLNEAKVNLLGIVLNKCHS